MSGSIRQVYGVFKGLKLKEMRNGLLFILPWLIGFALFTLYPIGSSLYYSFCNYNLAKAPEWIGLDNYKELFVEDDLFLLSLYNTLYYVAFSVPLGLFISLVIALCLNMKIREMVVYRTIFYIPTLVPDVALAMVWMWLLNPQYGLMNSILGLFGLSSPPWLTDPKWSKPGLIIMSCWLIGGSMLIYLASLQDIPQQLYEAAELDGAKWYHKTIYVTLPMLSPAILFNLIMSLIGAFQYFTTVYIMTNGGPVNSTLFYALYLYRNAFQFLKMGKAAAMAWILFVIVMVCTVLLFRSSARWVYYRGER